jgi:hypothetical protein
MAASLASPAAASFALAPAQSRFWHPRRGLPQWRWRLPRCPWYLLRRPRPHLRRHQWRSQTPRGCQQHLVAHACTRRRRRPRPPFASARHLLGTTQPVLHPRRRRARPPRASRSSQRTAPPTSTLFNCSPASNAGLWRRQAQPPLNSAPAKKWEPYGEATTPRTAAGLHLLRQGRQVPPTRRPLGVPLP